METLITDPDWYQAALCAETDPEAFYPEPGVSAHKALQICKNCEVRAECLQDAIVTEDEWGVWGGFSYPKRKKIQKSLGTRPPVEAVRNWLKANG